VPLDGLVPTKAGPVCVRVVCVELVALVVVLVVAVALDVDEVVEPVDVEGLEEELELCVGGAAVALEVVLAGTVRVTVTVAGVPEPQAASVTARAAARKSGVTLLGALIGRCRFRLAIAAASGYRPPRRERER